MEHGDTLVNVKFDRPHSAKVISLYRFRFRRSPMAQCTAAQIAENCACTYRSCSKRGKCCECVAYHNSMKEFPACFFTAKTEKTYDRSFQALCRDRA
jgi:hypothetical protein